jgi:hypothetical protein
MHLDGDSADGSLARARSLASLPRGSVRSSALADASRMESLFPSDDHVKERVRRLRDRVCAEAAVKEEIGEHLRHSEGLMCRLASLQKHTTLETLRHAREQRLAVASSRVVHQRDERVRQRRALQHRLTQEFLQRQRLTAFSRTITRVLLDRAEEQAHDEMVETRAAFERKRAESLDVRRSFSMHDIESPR